MFAAPRPLPLRPHPQGRRLAFVINSLTAGGAQRVFSVLLGHFAGPGTPLVGCELHLVTLDREPEMYASPRNVQRHALDTRGSLFASVKQLSRLLDRLQPDAVISFLARANCANVLASRERSRRSIISERSTPSEHFGRSFGSLFKRTLVRALYPRADGIIAVSDGVREDLIQHFRVPADRTVVIHNPYNIEAIRALAAAPAPDRPGKPYIVAVGRLVPSKNYPMLIRAFAASSFGGDLIILGEGPERETLSAKIERAGVQGRVHLPGHRSNPFPLVRHATLYASASNYEGFPNAMAEAMVLGRPVVSTNCRSGPAELLQGEAQPRAGVAAAQCGFLVPVGDVAALAEALTLMAEPGTAHAYGARAAGRMADFSLEVIGRRYAEAILPRDEGR